MVFTGEAGFPVEADMLEVLGTGTMGGDAMRDADPELFKNCFTASMVSRTSLSCPCSSMTMK